VSDNKTSIEDFIGIEHSKLNFFQELRQSIDELTTSNRKSEDQRREIAAILDGITDVMMVLSEDLRIISVNHVFRELFGEEEPEGKYCYELFRKTTFPCPECPAFRSLSTDTVCRETAIFRINGRNMQFQMVASPIKEPPPAQAPRADLQAGRDAGEGIPGEILPGGEDRHHGRAGRRRGP